MKRIITATVCTLFMLCLLTGCCSHLWYAATCITPQTCQKCGEIEGEALGHTWEEATCIVPKTCSVCKETEGEAMGHTWKEATTEVPKTCVTCGKTEGSPISRGPNFGALYDTYCRSRWGDVGSDGSYLRVDTNPDDEDDKGVAYVDAYEAIGKINDALGLPQSLLTKMGETRSLDGKQTETFTDVGITVSWSYHPDYGLEVTYKKIN